MQLSDYTSSESLLLHYMYTYNATLSKKLLQEDISHFCEACKTKLVLPMRFDKYS